MRARYFIPFLVLLAAVPAISLGWPPDAWADSHDGAAEAADDHGFDDSIWEIGGSRFRVAFHPPTSRLLGTWEKSEKIFLDVTVSHDPFAVFGGVVLHGEISIKFPNAKQACPELWRKWTDFEGRLSSDGAAIEGKLRELRIDLDTCVVSPTGEQIDLTFRRVVTPVATLCDPPKNLAAAVRSLEEIWREQTRARPKLPKQALFRRKGLTGSAASDFASTRAIVDQQIKNRGTDDWLLAAGRDGGAIRRLIDEVRPFLAGKAHCERADWQALAARLEPLVKKLRGRHSHVRAVSDAVETNYRTWGAEIQKTLDGVRSDRTLTVRALRTLGVSQADAMDDSQLLTFLSVVGASLKYTVGLAPNPLSAISNTWQSFVAALDIGDLMRGKEMLPFYLEMAEYHAWLQPLEDAYLDLEQEAVAIVKSVREHVPAPRRE